MYGRGGGGGAETPIQGFVLLVSIHEGRYGDPVYISGFYSQGCQMQEGTGALYNLITQRLHLFYRISFPPPTRYMPGGRLFKVLLRQL